MPNPGAINSALGLLLLNILAYVYAVRFRNQHFYSTRVKLHHLKLSWSNGKVIGQQMAPFTSSGVLNCSP
jgi:hypothetical protein